MSLSLAITFFGLIAERYPPAQDARWTTRLHTLIGDPTTWRDFAWTGLCGVIGMTCSICAVLALGAS
ncbi:MAG TPA: hypothetical protein VNA28_05040 [Solirubrobacteraceae bacterium]|nr:hypothetical protein [Solirubrobacteraceae bacterium]